jgi:hypothetical protein
VIQISDQTEVQSVIILDACIVRGLSLDDSSADLLRALRAVGERVAIPWMVAGELLAQRVLSHQDGHDAAAAALANYARHTPWKPSFQVEEPDVERVRKHWTAAFGTLVETLPPSPTAMQAAFFREANALPPCKKQGRSGGARGEFEEVQRHSGCQTVHRQRGGLDVGSARRYADHRLGRDDQMLGVGAVRSGNDHDGHDVVADGEIGVGPLADLLDNAGRVHSRHVGRFCVGDEGDSAAHHRVDGVDRRRVYTDPDLARPGVGDRKVQDPQHVGPAKFSQPYGLHGKSFLGDESFARRAARQADLFAVEGGLQAAQYGVVDLTLVA